MRNILEINRSVKKIYDWLDEQIASNRNLIGGCKACGRCCDFERFDHILFVTTPELIYLKTSLSCDLKKMTGSICPYNIEGKCSVYDYRFTACRIFYCSADKELQYRLSASVSKQLKLLCDKLNIPYYYCDLKTALNIKMPALI